MLAKDVEVALDQLAIAWTGVDAIHPDFGLGGKEKRLEPMPYPQAWRVFLAERTKRAVSLPVIAVGVIREPGSPRRFWKQGRRTS